MVGGWTRSNSSAKLTYAKIRSDVGGFSIIFPLLLSCSHNWNSTNRTSCGDRRKATGIFQSTKIAPAMFGFRERECLNGHIARTTTPWSREPKATHHLYATRRPISFVWLASQPIENLWLVRPVRCGEHSPFQSIVVFNFKWMTFGAVHCSAYGLWHRD